MLASFSPALTQLRFGGEYLDIKEALNIHLCGHCAQDATISEGSDQPKNCKRKQTFPDDIYYMSILIHGE